LDEVLALSCAHDDPRGRANARESSEFVGKRSGIFSEGALQSCRLRLRQRHQQSDRKRAHRVLNQKLLHADLLYVTKRLVLLVTSYADLNAAFFTPHVFLAMRLLTGQYAAKNQCSQEK